MERLCRCGFPGVTIFHQLYSEEQARAAHVADQRLAPGRLLQPASQITPDVAHIVFYVLFLQ
jgi:hypothetical protein